MGHRHACTARPEILPLATCITACQRRSNNNVAKDVLHRDAKSLRDQPSYLSRPLTIGNRRCRPMGRQPRTLRRPWRPLRTQLRRPRAPQRAPQLPRSSSSRVRRARQRPPRSPRPSLAPPADATCSACKWHAADVARLRSSHNCYRPCLGRGAHRREHLGCWLPGRRRLSDFSGEGGLPTSITTMAVRCACSARERVQCFSVGGGCCR